MELARRELGEEALLVNARPATAETRHLGAYEVVFGAVKQADAPPAASVIAGSVGSRVAGAGGHEARDRAPVEAPERRAQVFRVFGRIEASRELYARLIENELDPMLAQTVAQGAPLEEMFEVDATLGRRGASRAVVALVGPPGVGKTTTLVKLAARYGLASRKPAQILSADVFRIAAAEQLRELAAILGVGCDVVETPVALAQALEEHRSKDFVFIDTPGLASGDMEDGARSGAADRDPPGDRHAPGASGVDEAGRHGAGDRALRNLSTQEAVVYAGSTRPAVTARSSAKPRGAGCRFRS